MSFTVSNHRLSSGFLWDQTAREVSVFGLAALTAVALDKRKREVGMEREKRGREKESACWHPPSWLGHWWAQSLWEPEMARLMNGSFLLPPQPTPTSQFSSPYPPARQANPYTSPCLATQPPPCIPLCQQNPLQTPQTRAPRPALAPPSPLACPPSAPLNRACVRLACQATHA